MEKIIDYGTVAHAQSPQLDLLVRKKITEGWQPYGSPYVIATNGSSAAICQALVKYGK
jgi:hypothetical protein